MERNHVWKAASRATQVSLGDGPPRRRARRPVAIDRPREEQTWPAPMVVRATPPRMTSDVENPCWPGRPRPAVPLYQQRLDRHADSIVATFRVHQEHRTMAGRRRGLTTHRRPCAIVSDPFLLGRGSEAHYREKFSGSRPQYRRLRVGGMGASVEGFREAVNQVIHNVGGMPVVSPRRAAIALLAVMVLVMGAVGTGMAQQRYVVQQGDTIDSIAETFGVDPLSVRSSSYLPTGDDLQVGQVLVIPDPGQTPSDAALMAGELEGTNPWVSTAYWVEFGDTLSSIALKYGVDPATLAEFNDIQDPASLIPGDRMLIPSTPSNGGWTDQPLNDTSSAVTVPGIGTYYQQRNLSCEYAATHIATSAFGTGIEEDVFIDQVPLSDNPHHGYRGNIDGWWGNTDDYGIYPEPLVPVLNDYGFVGEVLYTEGDRSQLTAHIDAGHTVVVWLGFWGDTRERLSDDGDYSVAAGMHVVVVYGYDDDGVYVSDPAIGSLDYYSWEEFVTMWKVLDGMSLAVYPA